MCGTNRQHSATYEPESASSAGQSTPQSVGEAGHPAMVEAPLIDLATGRRSLNAGDQLVETGTRSQAYYIVIKGMLASSAACGEGGHRVLGFHLPGDLLMPGSSLPVWDKKIRAVAPAEVAILHLDALERACGRDPRLALRFAAAVRHELGRRVEDERRLRALSVEGRFAAFLIDLGRRMGKARDGGVLVPLPMMRTEIANYLGFRTETACRILARWKKRGLIASKGRHCIEVPDFAKLRVVADELGAPNVA